MIINIDKHLYINITSFHFDTQTDSWTVNYIREAWGMKTSDYYGFSRVSFGYDATPNQIASALVEILKDKVNKI